jgi:hypothetical protein
MIFFLNSIEVLVLPAHSSHLLQMSDVSVASPLKTEFKQELEKWLIVLLTPSQHTERKRES